MLLSGLKLLGVFPNFLNKSFTFQTQFTGLLKGEDRGELSYSFPSHNINEENTHSFFTPSKYQLETTINASFYFNIQRLKWRFISLIKEKIFRFEQMKPALDFTSQVEFVL